MVFGPDQTTGRCLRLPVMMPTHSGFQVCRIVGAMIKAALSRLVRVVLGKQQFCCRALTLEMGEPSTVDRQGDRGRSEIS